MDTTTYIVQGADGPRKTTDKDAALAYQRQNPGSTIRSGATSELRQSVDGFDDVPTLETLTQ